MTFSCPFKSSIIPELLAPASNTRVTSEPFPPVAYEGSRFVLSCDVAKGSHLSYTWFFNRTEVTSSTASFLHLTGNKLMMGNVTPQHAGYYSCMAWSRVQNTTRFSSSAEVQVMVKGMCQQNTSHFKTHLQTTTSFAASKCCKNNLHFSERDLMQDFGTSRNSSYIQQCC